MLSGLRLVKCPHCGKECYNVNKEWNYASFHVKFMVCESCDCGKSFTVYYHKTKFSHIIAVRHGVHKKRTLVINYLKTHENATIEEIARELNFKPKIILGILLKLEKMGLVTSTER